MECTTDSKRFFAPDERMNVGRRAHRQRDPRQRQGHGRASDAAVVVE
jgi:hypothetical protein